MRCIVGDPVEDLARNLRSLRGTMGVTQTSLAELCGVPRSTIANIEAGGSNPTLSVLLKISGALRIGLEELLSAPWDGVQHFKASELQTIQRGAGRINKLLPHPVPGMEIDRIELPSGAHIVGVPHSQGTHEYLCCERGALIVWTAGQRVEMAQGDVVAFPGDQKHSYLNEGHATAVAFSVVTLTPAELRVSSGGSGSS